MTASLRTGTLLGHYRIVAPLGTGGMGEVFKAHDTTLDRPVALKILPAEVVRDPERVRRFGQEAKAASSLSHPNIVTIHEIGAAVPRDESGPASTAPAEPLHYIAMELVEGSTLRQLLDDRTIEPRTLLAYLAQAAEGLAKAHSVGIVHRDLKPENIMVTRDGYAKVLDFGLAKLAESAASGSALAAAPTALQDDKTKEGVVMGTIGYMSPEQAQGKPVDHRTDLFAFGCLLYEAATGRRPFTGESSVDVLHAIVREKPTPIEQVAPTIPSALVRTIRRCLAKEPERRYQSMKDLALELHDMVDEWETLATPSGTVSSASAYSATDASPATHGPGRSGWIAIAAGGLTLVIAVALIWRLHPGAATRNPEGNAFQSMRITPLTSNGTVVDAALSPDGRYLAYLRIDAAGVSLWVRQVATGSDVQILPPRPSDRPLEGVSFAPGGEYVDYVGFSDDPRLAPNLWELHRIPVLGGTPRKIVSDIDSKPAYSPDGKQLAFLRQDPAKGLFTLLVAAIDGSDERPLASRDYASGRIFLANQWGLGPAWSPDGSRIALAGQVVGRDLSDQVVIVDVASGKESVLGAFAALNVDGVAWANDGRSLLVTAKNEVARSGNQIWRLAVPSGTATRVTNDLASYHGVAPTADGKSLSAIVSQSMSELWKVPLARGAAPRSLTRGVGENYYRLSSAADGTLVASIESGTSDQIWRISPDGSDKVQLTHGGSAFAPEISRDGTTIVYLATDGHGDVHLFAMDRDGGDVRQLGSGGGEVSPTVSPDGGTVVFVPASRMGLWHQSTRGGEATEIADDPHVWSARYSPDGTRICFSTTRSVPGGVGKNVLVVIPAAGGAAIAEVARPSMEDWSWSPDGAAAVFVQFEGDHSNLWRLPFDGKPAERLTEFAEDLVFSWTFVDGGKTIVYSRGQVSSDAVLVSSFQ